MADGALPARYADRVFPTQAGERDAPGVLRECDGRVAVEDFGTLRNLMLGRSAVPVTSKVGGGELPALVLRHGGPSTGDGTFDGWLQARVLDHDKRKIAS